MPADQNIERPTVAAGDPRFVIRLGATWRSVLNIGHYSGVVNRGVEKCRKVSNHVENRFHAKSLAGHTSAGTGFPDYGKTTS
jgi:hypothetical protein